MTATTCHMDSQTLALIAIPERTGASLNSAELLAALERHHADCLGWAIVCCGFDPSEASDVLQDTYLKVLDGRAVFRGESSFRTWLFGVVRRTASEYRRNVLRRLASLARGQSDGLSADAPDPHELIDRRALALRLRQALISLPARQRQVLHLVFHDDLTVEAAAGVMGVTIGSARTHYARGKDRLRALLQQEGRR